MTTLWLNSASVNKACALQTKIIPKSCWIDRGERVSCQVVPSHQDPRVLWSIFGCKWYTSQKITKANNNTLSFQGSKPWAERTVARQMTGQSDQVTGASNFLIFQSPWLRKITSPIGWGESKNLLEEEIHHGRGQILQNLIEEMLPSAGGWD